MPIMFRKGGQDAKKDEENDLPDDLLDKIPDLPEEKSAAASATKPPPPPNPAPPAAKPATKSGWGFRRAETPPAPTTPPATEARGFPPIPTADIHALLAHVQEGLHAKLSEEMLRVENDLGALLEHMRLQLIAAHADLEKWKGEAMALRKANEEHVKRAAILKELEEKLKNH